MGFPATYTWCVFQMIQVVSIPDRVLWVFRQERAKAITAEANVSIPDRVLWVFRRGG